MPDSVWTFALGAVSLVEHVKCYEIKLLKIGTLSEIEQTVTVQ